MSVIMRRISLSLACLAWSSCGFGTRRQIDSRWNSPAAINCLECLTPAKALTSLLFARPTFSFSRVNRLSLPSSPLGSQPIDRRDVSMNAEIVTAYSGEEAKDRQSRPIVEDAKRRLSDIFRTRSDTVLVDPIRKLNLQRKAIVFGSQAQQVLVDSSGVRYQVKSINREAVYADLVPRESVSIDKLGSQIADDLFSVFSVQTGLFRSPLVAFLYERGWRDQFKTAGFPGIDKEFAEVQDYFSLADGGTVVDLSCGSGLMTRRLVKSGRYARVLALDYSEEMLKETDRRLSQEDISKDNFTLVRADAAALPLRAASIDAIHAGAAMHCWPRLSMSLAEVRRSLKPGGRFFATTFFQGAYGGPQSSYMRLSGNFYFFKDEKELEDLLSQAGFSKFEVRREGRGCAVIRAEA